MTGNFSDGGLSHLERLETLYVLDRMKGGNFSTRALNDFRRKMTHLSLSGNLEKPPTPPPRTPRCQSQREEIAPGVCIL